MRGAVGGSCPVFQREAAARLVHSLDGAAAAGGRRQQVRGGGGCAARNAARARTALARPPACLPPRPETVPRHYRHQLFSALATPPDFVSVLPLWVPLEGLGGGAGNGQALQAGRRGWRGWRAAEQAVSGGEGSLAGIRVTTEPAALPVSRWPGMLAWCGGDGSRLLSRAQQALCACGACAPTPTPLPTCGTVLSASLWGKWVSKMERSR